MWRIWILIPLLLLSRAFCIYPFRNLGPTSGRQSRPIARVTSCHCGTAKNDIQVQTVVSSGRAWERRSPAISKLTATRLRKRTTTHLVDSIRYGTTDETIDRRLAAKRVTIRLAGWLVIQESSTLIRSVRARLPIPTRGSSQLASSDADSGARRASRSRAFTTVSTTGRSEEVL